MVGGSGDRSEDILPLHILGYDVDNNNMPAPENIPPSLIGQSPIQWKGADLRSGTYNPSPGISLKVIYNKTHKFVDLMREDYLITRLGWFLLLFPYYYFHAIFLPEINDAIHRRTVTMGELLNTLGCRF